MWDFIELMNSEIFQQILFEMLTRKAIPNCLFITSLATACGATQSLSSAKSVGKVQQANSGNVTSNAPFGTTSAGRETTPSMDLIKESDSSLSSLFLCDHPPNRFSPLFLGQSKEDCHSDISVINRGSFTETMVVCWTIYETIYKKKDVIHGKMPLEAGGSLILHADPALLQICLPLHERFDLCEKRDYITICWDAKVAFVHDLPCQRPSESAIDSEVIMGSLLLWNDTECFRLLCSGHITIISKKVKGLQLEMIDPLSIADHSDCDILNSGLILRTGLTDEVVFATNSHWPCCYPLYVIIWVGDPQKIALLSNWEYLSLPCQIAEIILIVLVAIVALSGFLGNLITILVIVKSKHSYEESTTIRISLAMSDFFISVFVSVPSFFYHISPLVYGPNYLANNLTKFAPENGTKTEKYKIAYSAYQLDFEGTLLLQGLVFSACHLISLLSIFLLSLERYLITWRPLKYKGYSNPRRARVVVIFVWIISILNTLLFSFVEEGHMQVVYLKFEKLPIAFEDDYSIVNTLGVLKFTQFWMLFSLGGCITLLSVLSIRNFHIDRVRVSTEWKDLNMKVFGPYSRENRYIFNTLIMIPIFFLLAAVPRLMFFIFEKTGYFAKYEALFSYLSWWALMAGTAWNPWIYNFRSRLFRNEAKRILLPAIFKRQLKTSS